MMNKLPSLALAASIGGTILTTQLNVAHAASTWGTVTFLGTTSEEAVSGGLGTTFRVRIRGTCGTDAVAKDRWVGFHTYRTDGTNNHNDVTTRNAYNTLLAAFLSGRSVQIDGLDQCDPAKPINVNIPWSGIGIY
jgi:hypothetical protein